MLTKTRHQFRTRLVLVFIFVIGMVGLKPAKSVLAASLTVTNANDSGPGSLRQAILDAPSGSTITFAPSLAGQTMLLASDLMINKDLTIDGSGLAPQLVISGGDVAHLVIQNSTVPPTVTISNLTIVHGYSSADGGAISVGGTLTLIDSTLKNNHAADDGGAIAATNLTLKNTTLAENQAGSEGGALLIYGNTNSTIVNSTITQNQAVAGGAISTLGITNINMIHSTVADNTASSGSELQLSSNGLLQLSNTIVVCTPSAGGCIIQNGNFSINSTNSLIGNGTLEDFGLADLADNGGVAPTMALLPGSVLIDAGNDSICANSPVNNLDQRGATRPRGSHCDIGAYEAQFLIRYVRQNATGANDGTSWTDAYTNLQSALAVASSNDEIWVAAGTYKPTPGTDRTISFTLKNGVAIYGGFVGTEISRTQRSPQTNVTVLSGDIGNGSDNSDNSYHVVVGSNTDNSAILDGFTVSHGKTSEWQVAPMEYNGAGMYSLNGDPTVKNVIFTNNNATFGGGMYNGGESGQPQSGSHPILENVVFENNSARNGGGMRNENYSSPRLTNVLFHANIVTRSGGGMDNIGFCDPILKDVTFDANVAGVGGGMATVMGTPELTNVTFSNNSAEWAGAMANGYSSPKITNATFYGNSATTYGGGISNEEYSNPVLKHVTFRGNTAVTLGGAIYSDSVHSNVTIQNSILFGDTAGDSGNEIYTAVGMANVAASIVQGGYPGTGNLDANPGPGPLQDNGGFTQTMALRPGSRAINAGDDTNCPATDQRGVTRPQGSHCDIGAYEYQKKSGNDTTGVFRPTNGALYLKNKNETGFADVQINYGVGGDYPIVGDWDGDGAVTIGIYRNGSFYLRNSNTIGFADVVFPFGLPGDQPIAGDWNGDGVDTVGVYHNGVFYLRNDNSSGAPSASFALGVPGDVGIAGDWDGDGLDTTGVFRPSNGALYLKNSNVTGFADIQINYGIAGDKPVTGDWNNDGIDTIGIYRNGTFYLRNSNTIGFADIVFALGIPGDLPIAGNWDGIP